MAATISDFEKCALEIEKRVVHGTIGSLSVYIVPAIFCDMRCINNPSYSDVEKEKDAKGKRIVVTKVNVHLIEA